MKNVNLKDARQGTSTEEKQGKVYRKVIAGYTVQSSRNIKADGTSTSWCYRAWLRLYDLAGAEEPNRRLADLSPLVSLLVGDLKPYDLVDVRLSDDDKEILEIVKVGHASYMEDEVDVNL